MYISFVVNVIFIVYTALTMDTDRLVTLKTFLVVLVLQIVVLFSISADSTSLVEPVPNYKLKFIHSGSETYSFALRNADGSTLSESEVGIEHTTEEQPVCQALVITNQTGTTFNYSLSWNVFTNGVSNIPYSLRLTRSSLPLASATTENHSLNLTLSTRDSGIGSRTYELCTIYLTLDEAASAAATGGRYSDNLTFTLTPDA